MNPILVLTQEKKTFTFFCFHLIDNPLFHFHAKFNSLYHLTTVIQEQSLPPPPLFLTFNEFHEYIFALFGDYLSFLLLHCR